MLVALLAAAVAVRAYDNAAPHSKLPPLGWSSWVALGQGASHPEFDFCDESSVMSAIDAFVSDDLGLFAAGYRHFHLDDCWADHERTAAGDLIPDTASFPNGLKPIIDYAHSKGLVFGLYTSGERRLFSRAEKPQGSSPRPRLPPCRSKRALKFRWHTMCGPQAASSHAWACAPAARATGARTPTASPLGASIGSR